MRNRIRTILAAIWRAESIEEWWSEWGSEWAAKWLAIWGAESEKESVAAWGAQWGAAWGGREWGAEQWGALVCLHLTMLKRCGFPSLVYFGFQLESLQSI